MRDALLHPFEVRSIWNMPLGKTTRRVPAGINTENRDWYPIDDDSDTIVLTPGEDLMPIRGYIPGPPFRDRWFVEYSKPTDLWERTNPNDTRARLPIPPDLEIIGHINNGQNLGAAIMDVDGDRIWQMQPFAKKSAHDFASANVFHEPLSIRGPGIRGAHGGSNLSTLGGTIRMHELRPGSGMIHHVLKLSVHDLHYHCGNGNRGYRWPANNSDTGWLCETGRYRGTIPEMRMGSLVALPEDFDLPGLRTEPMKRIAWTLIRFGAYIVDSQTWDVGMLSMENGPAGSARLQFFEDWGYNFSQFSVSDHTRDWADILRALEVVDSNNEASIGGAPTPSNDRMAPFAEALSTGQEPTHSEAELIECARLMEPYWRFVTDDPDHLKAAAMRYLLERAGL